ncbi:cytochrome-c oxidase, cbb3-type subunit III [Thermomonas carbonis]|uniref:Cbb3-type cytochrome c oxidase subunit n=1 Tax=Thermomonas carbonis TaxID=1463158 RepID=A0A7G9SQH1_9GAMM|nr:cytochrome-c oxidase, cbb3-type subunit III [Thermomonas carbonis]QNN70096.1 cytochrome-c oxidase, cbb3-type subunit III [Thermomonas carbonis]GHB97739.1 Cbb3-type cytochrome c oxidase subunit [Thermomonas carbonis]
MTAGWSWYVIALVTLNIVGCVWLLWWTARRRPGDPKPEDTSHVWDGDLTEYNKPLPRWWINMFYLTIVFAIGYLVWYPGFGNFAGVGKWTSQVEHDRDAARATATLEKTFAPYQGQPIDVLARNPQAVKLGSSIFGNTCATCHGSSGKGAIGYPDLTDDVWHWGGSPEQVLQSVLDGREGVMPPWGKILGGMAGADATDYVIAHVRALGDASGNARGDFAAARGKTLYEGVCVACHGVDGKGNQALGAPDLTDDYWMYGDSREALREGIANGHHGIMPAHRALLGETRARLAAAYVWSLSHSASGGKAE